MPNAIAIYAAGLISFLALDAIWLGTMVPRLYKPAMGDLVADPFQPVPAVVFYLIYAAGLAYFAIQPALLSGKWSMALISGAALGFVAYATYDLTNQATIRAWPVIITVVDLAWGTVASGVAALISYLVLSRWLS
ncbi:MAG: rane protein [Proteobacteria bacterium]|nr:rane protein [Pseudomonadota bacterium]